MNEQEAKAVVLEWLKTNFDCNEVEHGLINELHCILAYAPRTTAENEAINTLSIKSEFELLADFAEWGLREGAK